MSENASFRPWPLNGKSVSEEEDMWPYIFRISHCLGTALTREGHNAFVQPQA